MKRWKSQIIDNDNITYKVEVDIPNDKCVTQLKLDKEVYSEVPLVLHGTSFPSLEVENSMV